jgi:hypothetical protein
VGIRVAQVTNPPATPPAVKLIDLPPGPGYVVIANEGSIVGGVSYGVHPDLQPAGATSGGGAVIPPNSSVSFLLYPGGSGQTLYIIANGAATNASVSVTVSTPN